MRLLPALAAVALLLPAGSAVAATPAERAGALADAIVASEVREPAREGAYGRYLLAAAALLRSGGGGGAGVPAVVTAPLATAGAQSSPFSLLGFAEAAGHAALPGHVRPALERTLARYNAGQVGAKARACFRTVGCYNNLRLVEAAGAVVARPWMRDSGARDRTDGLVANIAADVLAQGRARGRGSLGREPVALVSDQPTNPLAYHALSAFALGRIVEAQGERASADTRTAARRAVAGLLALAAPDGDVSSWGRGQDQTWTRALAAAACALHLAAAPPGDALRPGCAGLIDAELTAIDARRSEAGVSVLGRPAWERGVDRYVNREDYDGLAAYALAVAADRLARPGAAARDAVAPPAARDGFAFTDTGPIGVAATTYDGTWMLVRLASSHPTDARYDAGLVAAQRRDADGGWRALVEPRPFATGSPPPTAGPLLRPRGSRAWARFVGTDAEVLGGTIRVTGTWRVGARAVRTGSLAYVVGADGGVQVHFAVRRGDRHRLHAWTAPGAPSPFGTGSGTGRRRASRHGNARHDRLDEHTLDLTAGRSGRRTIRLTADGKLP